MLEAFTVVCVQVEGCGQKPVVPATGDIVTVRILSVNPRFGKVTKSFCTGIDPDCGPRSMRIRICIKSWI